MNNNKGSVEFSVALFLIVSISVVVLLSLFIALDWKTGEHGSITITAIDSNLFGTYEVYVRNSDSLSGNETLEVIYCIDADDQKLADFAKSVLGKKNIKLIYPERRLGFFWFDKCRTTPIKDIILLED